MPLVQHLCPAEEDLWGVGQTAVSHFLQEGLEDAPQFRPLGQPQLQQIPAGNGQIPGGEAGLLRQDCLLYTSRGV